MVVTLLPLIILGCGFEDHSLTKAKHSNGTGDQTLRMDNLRKARPRCGQSYKQIIYQKWRGTT